MNMWYNFCRFVKKKAMKKISFFLSLFLVFQLNAQFPRSIDDIIGFERAHRTYLPHTSARVPQAVLEGLDSITVTDALFGLLIKGYRFNYDDRGNTVQYERADYDVSSGAMQDGIRVNMSYTADNKLSVRVEYGFDVDNGWTPYDSLLLYYDTNRFLDSSFTYFFDDGQWSPHHYSLYTNDSEGYVTEIDIYNYSDNSFNFNEREIFTYDNEHNLLEQRGEILSGAGWENSWKITYTYQNGLNTLITYYAWDDSSQQWVALAKEEMEYDANGNITSQTISQFDLTNATWQYVVSFLFTYDSDGALADLSTATYDDQSSSWVIEMKITFTHDASVTEDQLLIPSDEAIDLPSHNLFVTKPVSGRVYQGPNQQYVANVNFYYSPHNVGVPAIAMPYAVYPNPVHDYLYIGGKEKPAHAEIFGLTGNSLMRAENPDKLDLRGLKKGVYILRLSDGKNTWSVKIQKL